jgi:alkylation response protein AidB-like acyl-CoA dehydrogenase
MESSVSKISTLSALHFLKDNVKADNCYVPSDITEEHKMVADMVDKFIEDRIYPNVQDIEKQKDGIGGKLMEEAGELGILSAHMPETYGGMHMDFISNTLIARSMGTCGSFSVSYNAHTGIGMLPILYFGTEEQKQKYLPKLGSGEWKASYCLTEPSSGSDALSAKSTAELTPDGEHYIINGQKMWISNAGFADLFIVFAQIDGNKFTGFIVEKGTEGMTLGAEEDKLGIKGSSTRQVFFENVKIPKDNLLGEIGKGHLIAFNVLNIGRYKLGVSCLGGSERVLKESIRYANERVQFKVPISSFGAIKHKLAEQSIRNYVLESSVFRMAGFMDDKIKSLTESGVNYGDAKLQAAEEYAIECSIIKVLGSEVLDYVVDEGVQIFGGMGYSEEAPMSRAYRDSRINRIFEGTNEINRLLIVSMLFKKAMKGSFDIATPAMAAQKELKEGVTDISEEVSQERNCIASMKKLLYILLGYAGQKVMSQSLDLKDAQEPVMNLADIIIDIYASEATVLRNEKEDHSEVSDAKLKTFIHDASHRVYKNAIDFIGSTAEEKDYKGLIVAAKKYSFYPIQNTMKLRRIIAEDLITE